MVEILCSCHALCADRSHGGSWEEFVQDMGLRNSYEAQAVLIWLGY